MDQETVPCIPWKRCLINPFIIMIPYMYVYNMHLFIHLYKFHRTCFGLNRPVMNEVNERLPTPCSSSMPVRVPPIMWISALNGLERGWYNAPFNWMNGIEQIEFASLLGPNERRGWGRGVRKPCITTHTCTLSVEDKLEFCR